MIASRDSLSTKMKANNVKTFATALIIIRRSSMLAYLPAVRRCVPSWRSQDTVLLPTPATRQFSSAGLPRIAVTLPRYYCNNIYIELSLSVIVVSSPECALTNWGPRSPASEILTMQQLLSCSSSEWCEAQIQGDRG